MDDDFTWTQEYKRTWDEGAMQAAPTYPHTLYTYSPNRKNIIRHLLLAIDTSASAEKLDFFPTIRGQITQLIPAFVARFASLNPLSNISFITCNNILRRYSKQLDIPGLLNTFGTEDFSFLNCLRAAVEILKNSNYARECLVITASIGTKDSSSFEDVIRNLKKFNIRVSVISICGEVTIFRRMTEVTNGIFRVPVNASHLETIFNSFSGPLVSTDTTSSLARFGFPEFVDTPGLCSCHLQFQDNLYECPSCKTYVCSLPVLCPICSLHLASPLNIAKSYHYMNPLKPFEPATGICRVCSKEATSRCTDCGSVFCASCCSFLHEDLCFCIYCGQA